MKKKTREERKNLIIQLVEDSCYVPMKEKELAIFMQVEPEEREELKSILQELLNEGSTSRETVRQSSRWEPLSATVVASVLWRWKVRRKTSLYRRSILAVRFISIRYRWRS